MAESTPVSKAVEALVGCKKSVKKLLKDPEHAMILLGAESDLDRIINRLSFLAGIQINFSDQEEMQPVTNFMGEELNFANQVDTSDFNPDDEERKAFIEKVQKLFAEFDTLEPEGILNSHTIPDDVLLVRAVAKKAGVEGYEDKPMQLSFIEEIQAAIKKKAADEQQQAEIDKKLKGEQESLKGGQGK